MGIMVNAFRSAFGFSWLELSYGEALWGLAKGRAHKYMKRALTLTDLGCEPTPRSIPVTAWSMPPGDVGEDVTAADPGRR